MTTQANSEITANRNHLAVLFTSSVLITFLLFFVDEGYYDFRWMTNIGSWIPFIVYLTAIFSGQWLFSALLLKKYRGPGKLLLSILGGATIGILVVIFGVF
jgi:hypothetical protein